MRYHFFTLLPALMLSVATFAAKEVLPYKNDVAIDGNNKEWPSPLPKYNKTTGINYALANDERNLYFIIRIADEATQRHIMRNGLEIWINKEGKKKKTTGVTFPLPMSQNSKAGRNGGNGQNIQDGQRTPEGRAAENQPTEDRQNTNPSPQGNNESRVRPTMGARYAIAGKRTEISRFSGR